MAKSVKKATAQDAETGKKLPVEEFQNQLPAVIQPPPQLTAEQQGEIEVAKFDVSRSWIAEKKTEYLPLTISGVDDKEGFKIVEKAWQEIKNKRIAVKNKHESLKADYLTISRAIDKEKNELTDLLEEIEQPLKAELDWFKKQKEDLAQAEEKAKQEKLQSRVVNLIEKGMNFNGSYYVIGNSVSIDAVTLKIMTDEDFEKLSDRVQTEKSKIQAETQRIAEEKRQEEQRIQDQKIENERLKNELADQQAELQRQKDELEQQKQQQLKIRTDARAQTLEALGMMFNYKYQAWTYKTANIAEVATMSKDAVDNFDLDQWDAVFRGLSNQIVKIQKEQSDFDIKAKAEAEALREEREKEAREKSEKEQRFKLREARIISEFGMKLIRFDFFERIFKFDSIDSVTLRKVDVENHTDIEWNLVIEEVQSMIAFGKNQERILQIKQEEEKETARVAALSDVDKVNEYLQKFEKYFVDGIDIKLHNEDIKSAFWYFTSEVNFLIQVLKERLTEITEPE